MMELDFFIRNYKNNGFPGYRYVRNFLKIFRINGRKKNGGGTAGDHTKCTKVKESVKKVNQKFQVLFTNE